MKRYIPEMEEKQFKDILQDFMISAFSEFANEKVNQISLKMMKDFINGWMDSRFDDDLLEE